MDIGGKGGIDRIIEVFKMYKGFTKLDIGELFTKDSNFKGTGAIH